MAQTLYLIDGHAQIFRAYYAPFPDLNSPSGEPTKAVHVFCRMLFNLIRDRQPDHLVMVMDVDDKTVFRRDLYPDYKANREAAPEDLGPQIGRIVQILEAGGVPILRRSGFEADDILATICERGRLIMRQLKAAIGIIGMASILVLWGGGQQALGGAPQGQTHCLL